MNRKEDAFIFYEKAFYIYEASRGKDSLDCADIGM